MFVTTFHRSFTIEERISAMNCFKRGYTKLMVTTNMLARGIDIPTLRVVLNDELPYNVHSNAVDIKTYQYRIGRSSRFGTNKIATS